ncbi:hypothetical protein L484_013613 [Morus notabilis]|uniref:Uncharacterized protein n=1 Tax=Morus notabilis TaxID=981085 RepID=W9QM32_9ROSA|nr:hypothetical protein L484_013613 [Morus notabilis]
MQRLKPSKAGTGFARELRFGFGAFLLALTRHRLMYRCHYCVQMEGGDNFKQEIAYGTSPCRAPIGPGASTNEREDPTPCSAALANSVRQLLGVRQSNAQNTDH